MENACKTGHIFWVEEAIERYGNRNSILYACRYGHLDLVKYLLSINAPINKYAILNAALFGHISMVKYLIGINAPIDSSAISHAVSNKRNDIARYLLWNGAPYDIDVSQFKKELYSEFEPVISEFIGPDISGLILQNLI